MYLCKWISLLLFCLFNHKENSKKYDTNNDDLSGLLKQNRQAHLWKYKSIPHNILCWEVKDQSIGKLMPVAILFPGSCMAFSCYVLI